MFKRVAPTLVCVVAVLAPLPFGSAEPFWGAVWCVLLGIALAIAAPLPSDRFPRYAIVCLLLVVGVWCGVVFLQYVPAGSLLPADSSWAEAARLLNIPITSRVAVYGEVPIAGVVPPLALTLALLTGLVLGSQEGFMVRIYSWVGTAGLIYAAYAIFAEVTNPTMLLWKEKTAYVDAVTGTFVNHNTAATFFGSIAVIWYLRTLRDVRRWFDFSRWKNVSYLAKKLTTLKFVQIWHALAFLVLLATTFMTRSRAGSLLTIATLALVSALYFIRDIKTGRRALIALAVAVAAGAFIFGVTGGGVANRIELQGVYDVGRLDAWRSSLMIVRDHPWLGSGLGTFAGIFPPYRAQAGGVWGVWDHAHSTPIELMVEMGIPFSTLVFALWVVMLIILLRAGWRGIGDRIYVIAGAGVSCLGTLHSLVDFSLQIPGYSIVCCTLTGASLGAVLRLPSKPSSPGDISRPLSAAKDPPMNERAAHQGIVTH